MPHQRLGACGAEPWPRTRTVTSQTGAGQRLGLNPHQKKIRCDGAGRQAKPLFGGDDHHHHHQRKALCSEVAIPPSRPLCANPPYTCSSRQITLNKPSTCLTLVLRCEYFNLHVFFFLCVFAAPGLDVRLFRSGKSPPTSWEYVLCGRATALVCALEDDAKLYPCGKVIFKFYDGRTELHHSQTEDSIRKRYGQTATTTTAPAKHTDSLKTQ